MQGRRTRLSLSASAVRPTDFTLHLIQHIPRLVEIEQRHLGVVRVACDLSQKIIHLIGLVFK
jgi:hypothetical protein